MAAMARVVGLEDVLREFCQYSRHGLVLSSQYDLAKQAEHVSLLNVSCRWHAHIPSQKVKHTIHLRVATDGLLQKHRQMCLGVDWAADGLQSLDTYESSDGPRDHESKLLA